MAATIWTQPACEYFGECIRDWRYAKGFPPSSFNLDNLDELGKPTRDDFEKWLKDGIAKGIWSVGQAPRSWRALQSKYNWLVTRQNIPTIKTKEKRKKPLGSDVGIIRSACEKVGALSREEVTQLERFNFAPAV